MTLAPHEFIRRFLLHVLPKGFHRIRHYGLIASTARKANIARARVLLAAPPTALDAMTKIDGRARARPGRSMSMRLAGRGVGLLSRLGKRCFSESRAASPFKNHIQQGHPEVTGAIETLCTSE